VRLLEEDAENHRSLRSMPPQKKANRLAQEKSLYLLQHANNPVDWYPWGEEAFEKARNDDKFIFLSIGYSTCYWCHVMEREIFENEAIAALMNKTCISIKVDREERPDIDQLYMKALQAMTGSGGWPMSIFMTVDKKPFFAGTYFPPNDRGETIGFPAVLMRLNDVWKNERIILLKNSEHITQFLLDSSVFGSNTQVLTRDVLDRGFEIFAQQFDEVDGGFGSAPKFPRPSVLNFLLRYYYRTGNTLARDMALTTLLKMAEGGMYDQIGSGFHRYSTDASWQIPHFEKMLYDQAQLVSSYLEAYQVSHNPIFPQVAREILAYVQRMMTHPEGGFYSAEDAESALHGTEEKEEGAFYVWKKNEIDSILSKKEATIVELFYGVKEEGNFNKHPYKEIAGENILSVTRSVEEIASKLKEKIEDVQAHLDLAKLKLFSERERRPKPHLDDKILLSWNGLMISAFARAYCVLADTSYLTTAIRAARFLMANLYSANKGTLLRRYRDGEAKYDAQLSDYAFFIQALLDLYEASFDVEWLQHAIKLMDDQIRMFYDEAQGGFFEISGTDPTILIRTKEVYDGAEPSGNSITILNLFRLAHIIDHSWYDDVVTRSLASFSARIVQSPESMPQFLTAVDCSFTKPIQIILSGDKEHPIIREMLYEIHYRFLPNKVLLLADRREGQVFLSKYNPFFKNPVFIAGAVKAYVCQQYTCLLPTSDVRTLVYHIEKELTSLTLRNDEEGSSVEEEHQ
jgi:uncharacterized protein